MGQESGCNTFMQTCKQQVRRVPRSCNICTGQVRRALRSCIICMGPVRRAPRSCIICTGPVRRAPRSCNICTRLVRHAPGSCNICTGLLRRAPRSCTICTGGFLWRSGCIPYCAIPLSSVTSVTRQTMLLPSVHEKGETPEPGRFPFFLSYVSALFRSFLLCRCFCFRNRSFSCRSSRFGCSGRLLTRTSCLRSFLRSRFLQHVFVVVNQFNEAHRSVITQTVTGLDNPGVTTRTVSNFLSHFLEKFRYSVFIL